MSTPPALVIRRAAVSDLDALVELEQASFHGDRLSRRQYRHHLASASACVLVAQASPSALAGAAVVLFRRGTRVARLYSLATAASLRGQGVGARLLAAAEAEAGRRACRVLRLEVHDGNASAIALYERAGYRSIGRYEGYYENGGDALRLEKPV